MSACGFGVGEDEPTVHFCGVGEVGHDDSGGRSEVIMIAVEDEAFNVPSCAVSVVSTRVS